MKYDHIIYALAWVYTNRYVQKPTKYLWYKIKLSLSLIVLVSQFYYCNIIYVSLNLFVHSFSIRQTRDLYLYDKFRQSKKKYEKISKTLIFATLKNDAQKENRNEKISKQNRNEWLNLRCLVDDNSLINFHFKSYQSILTKERERKI